jgi:ABC-type transport system involved in cytochrome c biogenesis ATPase subunit
VLLLDEPYADLDDTACGVVESVVGAWVERKGLVVWTSPTNEGGPRPDTTFRLVDGRLVHA